MNLNHRILIREVLSRRNCYILFIIISWKGKEIYEKEKRYYRLSWPHLWLHRSTNQSAKLPMLHQFTNPSLNTKLIKIFNSTKLSELTKKTFDGKYSIKVEVPKPENPSEVPICRYNYGKVVCVIFHNVDLTTYKITTRTGMNPGKDVYRVSSIEVSILRLLGSLLPIQN